MNYRIAIIQDRAGLWFVRRIELSVHDGDQDSMVYHCDKPLAGPFSVIHEAADWVATKQALEKSMN